MKIGLLGGSFNPPHSGHIHISLETKKRLNLKQVWWVPAKQNPFKMPNNFVWNSQRMGNLLSNKIKQCQQITENHPQILVKDFESKINSFYSIDLLKKLIRQYPQHKFFWIIGADNICQFHRWKNWREIINLADLAVCDRDQYFFKAVKSPAFLYAKKLGKIHFLKIKKSLESSTKIRNGNQ